MRYDDRREVYRDCRWCSGHGCLYCKNERDKAYKAAFPNGPESIATFENTEDGRAQAAEFMSKVMKGNI